MSKLLAFDLGAESGRAIVGHFDGERLALEGLHRFANGSGSSLRPSLLGPFAPLCRDETGPWSVCPRTRQGT